MDTSRKANVSFPLSLVATFAAFLVPVYLEFFRPINLDIAVSEDVFISNTVGGVPDIELSIAFRAKGPSVKALTVGLIEVTLRDTNTKEEHDLIFAEKENLPLIINGGDVVTRSGLFISSSDISTQMGRADQWFKEFSNLFPDQGDQIEDMRIRHREKFISTEDDHPGLDYQGQEQPDPFLDMLMENPFFRLTAELGKKDKDIRTIVSLLGKVPVDKIQEFVFFRVSEYEIDIKVFDPFNTNLATHKRKFKIDLVLSKSLRDNRFDKNTRIRTKLVSPI